MKVCHSLCEITYNSLYLLNYFLSVRNAFKTTTIKCDFMSYFISNANNHMFFLFSGNPFDCNCEVMWFREWLLSKGQNVVNLPKETRCNTPEEHAQKPIVKLNNSSFVCSCGNSVSSKMTNNFGTLSIFFLSVFMFFMCR